MAPNPIVVPHSTGLSDPAQQDKINPMRRLTQVPTSAYFAVLIALLVKKFVWPRYWLYSGAPILTFLILVGASRGHRILPFLHIWTLLATINLVYSVAGTSWLLYRVFTALCWPAILLTALFQFDFVAHIVRRRLRALLSQLDFVNDKIALFDIPALEIDTDVAGLMVIRSATFSLSSLTLEAHGVELSIKLTDDMELAIQVEKVTVRFFRRIEVSDVFANLKGGAYEMTFGELEESTEDADGNPLMSTDTPLLRAASVKADGTMPEKIRMTKHMTDGQEMKELSAKTVFSSFTALTPADQNAIDRFNERMDWIRDTNPISKTRKRLQKIGAQEYTETNKTLRAAICSHLHDTPSVPHPPSRSVKVTTLQNSSPPWVKRFEHRLPLLLRLLLNPLSYFHPISFSSITGTASGAWIKALLLDKVFGSYADNDKDLRKLKERLMLWLADANFAFEMDDLTGLTQVPILTEYDINAYLSMKDIMLYRTKPKQIHLHEVVRLGGADATFSIPSFLLPHHEHILPPIPTAKDKNEIKDSIENADGKPQRIQAERDLAQAEKDETNVQMSVHVRLPACFDQELLDFAAALVKATKIVEMEKESNDNESPTRSLKDMVRSVNTDGDGPAKSFKDLMRNVNTATKDSMKKAVVSGLANDRWIAKLVGKVTKALETAQGDVGYSGSIPVALEPYRNAARGEATKLLP